MAYKTITYCNVTSDLLNVYADIEQYKNRFILDSTLWKHHSGSIYKIYDSGYIQAVYEDDVELSEQTSLANVDASSEWFYDSTNDILYVRCSDDANPNTHVMEKGKSWVTFKETIRNDAQEYLEGYLRPMGYIIPIRPLVAPKESYNSRTYDYWIIKATAVIAIAMIVESLDPGDEIAAKMWKIFDNPEPEPGEKPGMLQRLQSGDYALKIQRATTEPGGFNIYEKSDLTATAYFDITGRYSGSHEVTWRIQIDTLGVPGTATYKISYDGGTTWDQTLRPTWQADGDIKRIHIGQGIYCRFVGTFAVGDYVDIHAYPDTDKAEGAKFGYIRMQR